MAYIAELLTRVSAANPILRKLRTTQEHTLPVPIPSNISLARLCAIGADPSLAHPIFLALVSELSVPGRPPLLISLDGLSHAMHLSSYRSASFEPIHAHSLFIVSWFLSYLNGRKALGNGGLVLAALSGSNSLSVPSLDFGLEQLEHWQLGPKALTTHEVQRPVLPFLAATGQDPDASPRPDPLFRHDQRVFDALCILTADSASSGVQDPHIQILRLQGLSVHEAWSLMEYWARSGMMRREVDDILVNGKRSVSGNAIIGELQKGCVNMQI